MFPFQVYLSRHAGGTSRSCLTVGRLFPSKNQATIGELQRFQDHYVCDHFDHVEALLAEFGQFDLIVGSDIILSSFDSQMTSVSICGILHLIFTQLCTCVCTYCVSCIYVYIYNSIYPLHDMTWHYIALHDSTFHYIAWQYSTYDMIWHDMILYDMILWCAYLLLWRKGSGSLAI